MNMELPVTESDLKRGVGLNVSGLTTQAETNKILYQLTYAPPWSCYQLTESRAASDFVHLVGDVATRMKSYGGTVAFFGIFAILCCRVNAEVTPWRACTYTDVNPSTNCVINELRINPCKEAAQGKPCRLKRGTNASIDFDYTANFDATTLEGRAYWASAVLDLPFLGMEPNACLSTACPVTQGQKQTYHMDLPISKKYPIRTYDVKWRLDNLQGQECCLIFQIKFYK